jgi:hypothetical protein
MATKSISTPTIPNPLKSLPWNIKKEQERQKRLIKTESAKLHRELGTAEDATFEEIQEVTNRLIAKAEAEGDVKKKIKVEVAKDSIMQIKLNERLAGLTVLTEDGKAQSCLVSFGISFYSIGTNFLFDWNKLISSSLYCTHKRSR